MKFVIIRMKEKTWKAIKKHCEVVYDICRNITLFYMKFVNLYLY